MSQEKYINNAFEIAKETANQLGKVTGVMAVVLGGSLARNEASPDSDIDLGIYYLPKNPPSIESLADLACELDDRHLPNLVTKFGEWGPWINGGGWLNIKNYKVDWIYRDITKVSSIIEACRKGYSNCHYQPGHPHGFHDHMYLAEMYYAQSLYDPSGIIEKLRGELISYPPLLKKTLIEKYLWEANFALETCIKSAKRNDIYYVTGCLFRSIACLVQVLFALNERYFINEKGSIKAIEKFTRSPKDFIKIVSEVMAQSGQNIASLEMSIDKLNSQVLAIEQLCSDAK